MTEHASIPRFAQSRTAAQQPAPARDAVQREQSRIEQRLASPLYGALMQVVELAGLAVQADVRAGRLFGPFAPNPGSYVSAPGLGLSSVIQHALQDWPMCRDSIFERLAAGSAEQHERLIRPMRADQNGDAQASDQDYKPLNTLCRVVDAIGLCLTMPDQGQAALVLLRCDRSMPFQETDLTRLRRLRSSLELALDRGYRQQHNDQTPAANATTSNGHDALQRVLCPVKQLASLSQTEHRVLEYLQTSLTERQIARQLGRSPHTIHVHVKSIYRKLAVCSRKELMALMQQVEARKTPEAS